MSTDHKGDPKTEEATGLSAFATKHPHFTIVVWLIVCIMGALSLTMLPKDLLPSANLPAVQILTFYAGMPVDHVEQDLSYRFERYTGQAVGIKKQESRSLLGVSIVKNFFNSSIDLGNALAQTAALVMSVLKWLPPGTQPPLILPFDPMASVPLALCEIGGEGKKDSDLRVFGRYWVMNSIQSVSGAMAPTIMGGTMREVVAYLNPKKLKKYNFSLVDVAQQLDLENTFVPAGDVRLGDFDLQILSNGIFDHIPDMNKVLLRGENGVNIKMKDVGRVEDSHSIQTNVVLVDDRPEVYVPIYRQPGSNSLQVVDDVRKAVKRLESSVKGFKLNIVGDQSVFIRKAIESISHEAMIGGGLAAIMILVFLGSFRATLAVLLSLPLSLLLAFAALKALGQSLNVMTLGGLALSIGVLVDNAIVVIEVIMQKHSLGLDAHVASQRGAQEVAMPVLASTLCTLVVFLPVIFLSGVVQILFSALALAVMAAMVASYLAAMTVIPLFTGHFLKASSGPPKGFNGWVQGRVNSVTEGYGKSLGWVVKRRRWILPSSLVILIAIGVFLVPSIGAELFPRADAGSFQIDLRGPTGYRIEKTTELSKKIEKKLREWIPPEDLDMIIINAGVFYGYPAAFTPNSGTQDVFFNVQLKQDRKKSSQYYAGIIREKLGKEFPQTEFGIELGGLLTAALNGGLTSPIDVQINGLDYNVSRKIANGMLDDIKKIRGAVDVRVQQKFDAPSFSLNVDRDKAMTLGITPDDVVKNVVSAVSNSSTFDDQIWIDPDTGIDYFMGVQFDDPDLTTMKDFLNIPITSRRHNRSIPLKSIATTHPTKSAIELNHVDLMPVIDIYLDAQGRDINGVASDVQKILDRTKFPVGYEGAIHGEISEMRSAVASLGGGFLLSAIMVYLILVIQFRSFLLPAIMMTTVPMGMIGVIIMLSFTHTYFSIQAAIGCIFVIGIAVSNSVLLIEYILHCAKEGGNLDEAILRGAKARLRPITMTALASMLGLLPMALGLGLGSEANIPLGRAVIGGQLLATILNFYLVPALFRMVYGWQLSKAKAPAAVPAPEISDSDQMQQAA